MSPANVKRFHKWLFWLWVFPGLPVSYLLRSSVTWVVILSVYTIIMEHGLGWRQEKQSDEEGVTR